MLTWLRCSSTPPPKACPIPTHPHAKHHFLKVQFKIITLNRQLLRWGPLVHIHTRPHAHTHQAHNCPCPQKGLWVVLRNSFDFYQNIDAFIIHEGAKIKTVNNDTIIQSILIFFFFCYAHYTSNRTTEFKVQASSQGGGKRWRWGILIPGTVPWCSVQRDAWSQIRCFKYHSNVAFSLFFLPKLILGQSIKKKKKKLITV